MLVFVVILGCAEVADELDTEAELGEPQLLSAANLANGPAECDFEAERARRVAAPEVDCGELAASATREQAEAAERCVLDAVEARRSFTLLHTLDALRTAYVGTASLVTIMNEVEQGGTSLPRMFSTSCRRLVQAEDCTPSGDALCLVCLDEVEHATECARDVGDCARAGNYSGSAACCPGLHRVEQRARVFSDDSSSSCAYSPVRLFACIEGFCGDGVCEPEEAVACGCALDCPMAPD